MNPIKSKRRPLTAREKLMRRRYTRFSSLTKTVYLQVEEQGFAINSEIKNQRHCEWTRDMLAIALDRIER